MAKTVAIGTFVVLIGGTTRRLRDAFWVAVQGADCGTVFGFCIETGKEERIFNVGEQARDKGRISIIKE